MTADQWPEVEALFATALERAPAAREAYVRAQAGSAVVAREVLSLLDAHDRSGVFDALAAVQDARERQALPFEPGTRIGSWEILHELGAGGMGAVYLARRADGQFEQTAALKILSADLLGGTGESRFFAERQILASLSHPNIARLLDGGISDDGRPYFVMEYVDGPTIDVFCDEQGLDVGARLRLFLSVCRAVEYAHQHLIVHRDIKPGNVLVTGQGVATLLDFGIAKLLDRDAPGTQTQPGARVLTPDYASPEQRHGLAITPASDVYQLGVLLHVLLVGCRPAGEALGTEAAPRSPTPPSRLAPERLRRRLRGDLDDIILKAVRPEPERRYPTAGQLADDLVRHLERRPVRARPDTLAYRAAKFARRHGAGLAAAAAVFLLLIGGAVGAERQGRRTAVERDRAEEVTAFLVGLFQSTDPAVALGDTVTVRSVLDRGARRVRAELGDQPTVQAALLEAIGEVYHSLGLRDSAIGLMEEALRTRQADGNEANPDLVRTLDRLAMFETEAGRFERAAPRLRQALAGLRRVGDPRTVAYAGTLTDIGYAWQIQGHFDLAEPLLTEALALYRRATTPSSGMGAALTNLGYLRVSRGDLDSAATLFRQSVDLRRRLLGEDDPAVARSLKALAEALARQGALGPADSAASAALVILQRTMPAGHPDIAGALALRGGILRRARQWTDAEATLREALALRIAAYGEEHFIVAGSHNDLALALFDQGRYAEAEPLAQRAWTGYGRRYGLDDPNTAIVELNLARILFRGGAADRAQAHYAHAVPIARRAFPRERDHLGDLASWGVLQCVRQPDQAVDHLSEAAGGLRPTGTEPARNDYLWALNAWGQCLARQGKTDAARGVLTESLAATANRRDDDPYRAFARKILEGLAPASPPTPRGRPD